MGDGGGGPTARTRRMADEKGRRMRFTLDSDVWKRRTTPSFDDRCVGKGSRGTWDGLRRPTGVVVALNACVLPPLSRLGSGTAISLHPPLPTEGTRPFRLAWRAAIASSADPSACRRKASTTASPLLQGGKGGPDT